MRNAQPPSRFTDFCVRISELFRISCFAFRISPLLFAALFGGHGLARAVELDHARDTDPVLEKQRIVHTFDSRLKGLWLEALARPEADLKRQAADAIAR